jgi:heptosyltransferase II
LYGLSRPPRIPCAHLYISHALSANGIVKILIVGPAWVGDMVLAQSLFKLLVARHPNAQIDVLAPAWTAPLLRRMPEVHEAIATPFTHGRLDLIERWRLGRRLRARGYDWAICLPNSLKSALPLLAARIPRRTGVVGELRYGVLNDVRPNPKKKTMRTVDRYVSLGLPRGESLPASIPTPRLRADAANARAVLDRLAIPFPQRPVLALAPGAEYGPAKRWPEENYAAIARAKIHDGWDVWLFGSQKDADVTSEIQRLTQNKCVDLAGRTALGDAVDLLSLATQVVSNDSGLMHIAAAVDRPLIAVYGSSDPSYTPPLSERARVLYLGLPCSPCFQRECPLLHLNCLHQIEPEMVLKAMG